MSDIDASAEIDGGNEVEAQGQVSPEVNANPDPSSGSGENHEEKSNGVQERINKITAQKYEEQRRADGLQRELEELRAQKPAAKSEPSISAPSLPEDPFDEDAMKAYHAGMLEYTNKAAENAAKTTFENQQQEQLNSQAQAAQQKTIQSFADNAIKDGVDLDKLRVAEQTVVNAGIKPEVGAYIISDPNGGKLVEYLASNPEELGKVVSMDPVSAGIHIATQIKPKALSSTPNVSNAPTPVPEIKGGGMLEVDEFDKKYPGVEFI